jgi:DNA-directed RNA polymerase specialized sigma24 family protein
MTRTLLSGHGPTTRGRRTGRDEEVADFVAARQAALLRTAYLLTGDTEAARELVSSCLATLYLSWNTVRAEGAEAFVRRRMFTAHTSPWRLLPTRRAAAAPADGDELWQRIRALPRRQRAVVVLCHYEGLSEAEAADVLDIGENAARTLLLRARSALGV